MTSITSEQIDVWREVPTEDHKLEFKEAKNSYDFDKLCAYCVAIGNEGGGHLLLGITDKRPRQVVGTTTFRNPVKTAEQLFTKLGFRVDVVAVDHEDGRVVVFRIPSRPNGTAYALEGKYLMRSGESLVPMSEDQLRTIFAEGGPDWLAEVSLSGLSAQQIVDLVDTQTYFDLIGLPYPAERAGVIDRLKGERLIDEQDNTFAISRIGAILLAKRLDDFPDISRKAPRVIVYNGTSKLDTKLDQPDSKGYAVGFQGLVRFVMEQLPQNEVIEDAIRKEVKLLPENLVRELVANALIHQDFSVGGTSVMIEIYEDRIELSNPGEPIVPIERFIDGYQSRNERLADLMRRMGICEEKGSGIDRVVRAAEALQLPAPDFSTTHQRTVVSISGPKAFERMNRGERVRACYQHCALRHVLREPMTNQSLRERFNLSEDKAQTTSQVISATTDKGLIKPDESVGGSKKYARYLPFWA